MERGFSLTEVLVSLLLVVSTLLLLLKQQVPLHRLLNQITIKVEERIRKVNQSEALGSALINVRILRRSRD